MIEDAKALAANIKNIARILSKEGRQFNIHLINQFNSIWQTNLEKPLNGVDLNSINPEHLIFYQSVAHTTNWMQDQEKDRYHLLCIYLQILIKAANLDDKNQVEPRVVETLNEFNIDIPKRLYGVIGSLKTWTRVKLPSLKHREILDLAEVQEIAFRVSYKLRREKNKRKQNESDQNSHTSMRGGNKEPPVDIRWTTLAPLKMYALLKGPKYKTPEQIYPPMGKAVSKGIAEVFGIHLGESANDYMISRDLHLKLANAAGTSIWDINSGFYRLAGGS